MLAKEKISDALLYNAGSTKDRPNKLKYHSLLGKHENIYRKRFNMGEVTEGERNTKIRNLVAVLFRPSHGKQLHRRNIIAINLFFIFVRLVSFEHPTLFYVA